MFKAKDVICSQLISRLGNLSGKSVLDYGCGSGDNLKLLLDQCGENGKITAVDCNNIALDKLKQKLNQYILSDRLIVEKCESPETLTEKFDVCFCHNVLECIVDKVNFINVIKNKLNCEGIFLLSHHDFDSAIYNSTDFALTRSFIHQFSDTMQVWQKYSDGQIGRKLPGIFHQSNFDSFQCETIRFVEYNYDEESYGFHMSKWIAECVKKDFSDEKINAWLDDLKKLSARHEYYFAIDVNVVKAKLNEDK